jgi:hypothetical protein
VVWRLQWPKDIQKEIKNHNGTITNSDVELAAAFLAYAILTLKVNLQHHSTYLASDNKPTVSWASKYSSKSPSLIPDRFLRLLAFMQRGNRAGPLDVEYTKGSGNNMADDSSRSWSKLHLPNNSDFLAYFNSHYPLPSPFQMWRMWEIPHNIATDTFSILRRNPLDPQMLKQMCTGNGGYNSVTQPNSTHGCKTAKLTISRTAAHVNNISLPLLLPCGTVSSTVENQLAHRWSRECFNKWLKFSSTMAAMTPDEASLVPNTSTPLSKNL